MRIQQVTHDSVINGNTGETVFIRIENNTATALEPSYAVVYAGSTSQTRPGLMVGLPGVAINLTTGITGKVAGVVADTVAASSLGFLQVFGPANVRTSASLASGKMVVTASANATNIGSVFDASESTAVGPKYVGAIVGWTLAHVNATNATVQLNLM